MQAQKGRTKSALLIWTKSDLSDKVFNRYFTIWPRFGNQSDSCYIGHADQLSSHFTWELDFSLPRLFASGSESSNFRSLELLHPGTFAPTNEIQQEAYSKIFFKICIRPILVHRLSLALRTRLYVTASIIA